MNIPLGRFNDRLRKGVEVAAEESRRRNHHFIGTEHLLLGILGENSEKAARILAALGVDVASVRREIEALVPSGPRTELAGQSPLTPRAGEAIELAMGEAQGLMQDIIGPEHLLVGLVLEGSGVAGVVLKKLALDTEKVRPEAYKVRLMQIRAVERIVRPIRAVPSRKRRMREELLAHLEANSEEELARSKDEGAAVAEAARRLGPAAELSRELEASLHPLERQAYRVERWFGWRAPESALRYSARLALTLLMIFAIGCFSLAVKIIVQLGWNKADWVALRPIFSIMTFFPLGSFLITFLYLKMRNALWGAFGARRSRFKEFLLGLLLAGGIFGCSFGFNSLTAWDVGRATGQIYSCLVAAIAGTITLIVIAQSNGGREISDTLWACLDLEDDAPRRAEG
jgi:hypothetical protein